MFNPIVGEAREFLRQLIAHTEDVSGFINALQRTRGLESIVSYLVDKKMLEVFPCYNDDGRYNVFLTYDGKNYFQEEARQEAIQKEKSSTTTMLNFGNGNILQAGIGNTAQTVSQKDNDIISAIQKLIDNLDECIPQESKEEIIENAKFIEEELKQEKPRKSIIDACFEKLKSIAAKIPMAVSLSSGLIKIAEFFAAKKT